jgi:hypothetical protein
MYQNTYKLTLSLAQRLSQLISQTLRVGLNLLLGAGTSLDDRRREGTFLSSRYNNRIGVPGVIALDKHGPIGIRILNVSCNGRGRARELRLTE